MGGEGGSMRHSGREHALATAFVRLADTLVDHYDVVELLQQLITDCVELLDVDAAGLMLADQRGGLSLVSSSSEQVRLIELFQLQADEGPCLDSVRTGRQIAAPDLTEQLRRWPSFSREARREGFLAVWALPLRLREEVIGALNLFRAEPGPIPESDLALGQALADVATIGILHERTIRQQEMLTEQLQSALNSRVVVEQAKGVLAERAGLQMDEAFQLLRRYARDHGRLLSQVCLELVEGRLDIPTVSSPR